MSVHCFSPTEERSTSWNAMKDILSGTAGGVAQVAAGPLDTIKVRLQTQMPRADGTMEYAGMVDCARKTFRSEGVAGLYKGAASPLLGAMLHNAGVFFAYGQSEILVGANVPNAPLYKFLLAGAMTGAPVSLIESPVDLFKIKLQAQVGKHGEYKGVFDAASKITKAAGIKGIYQGLPATTLRNIPAFAFYFMGAKVGYRWICPDGETHTSGQVFLGGVVGGAVAGFGFWGIIYPLEIVKTRMQSDATLVENRKYKSTLDCFRQTWAEGGPKAFFKGYTPTMMRAIPVNAAIFCAVFNVKALLE